MKTNSLKTKSKNTTMKRNVLKSKKNSLTKKEVKKPIRATAEPTMEKVLVTPQIAAEWLKKNKNNRPLKEKIVNSYTNQMKQNRWRALSPDGAIVFDTNGNLLNGQHRLNAIERSKTSYKFWVSKNNPSNIYNVLDTGSARTCADLLSRNGFDKPNDVAPIAKNILHYLNGHIGNIACGGSKNNIGMSNEQVLEYAQKNREELIDICNMANVITKGKDGAKWISKSHIGAFYYAFSVIDKKAAKTFFMKYKTGIDLPQTNPIRFLRTELISNMNASKKYHNRDKLALLVHAWNLFRDKKPCTEERLLEILDTHKEEFPEAI